MFGSRRRLARPAAPTPSPPASEAGDAEAATLARYTTDPPSNQAMVDLFAGEWSSALPAHLSVSAGPAGLFEDARIAWLVEQLGDLTGLRVLELGPLEGGHTYALEAAGAEVVAIEANRHAFLRCLVAKELLAMRSRFRYGDFLPYLATTTDRYDLILASGVLYHMTDPLGLLSTLADHAETVALWTHYYDQALTGSEDNARYFLAPPHEVEVGGETYTLHRREYLEHLGKVSFCGGGQAHANWLEREQLLGRLRQLGFPRLDIGFDHRDHPNGPALMVLARREP